MMVGWVSWRFLSISVLYDSLYPACCPKMSVKMCIARVSKLSFVTFLPCWFAEIGLLYPVENRS